MYGRRSFTGDRSPHYTGDADGCSARTYWAGTNIGGFWCSATSTEARATAASTPRVPQITGAAWQSSISARWSCSTTPGKPQKITRGPKDASKKSNLMWMLTPNLFRLPNHKTQKVQTSRLGEPLTVDANACTTPCTYQWALGSGHTIAATIPQPGETGM